MSYRRHGEFERQTGHGIGEVLLLLLREQLVLLVGRAAVPCHEGVHFLSLYLGAGGRMSVKMGDDDDF